MLACEGTSAGVLLHEGEKSTVKVVSLVGHPKLAVGRIFKGVDLAVTTIDMLWDVVSTLHSPPSMSPGQQMQ